MEQDLIEKYCQFIRVIMNRLNEHFANQKDYIKCKEGCSFCCKNGEYPCSELEFKFLKLGFAMLDNATQKIIIDKILKIKEEKSKFTGKKFIYECPFLLNNRCTVYNNRMIICRTFGLAYFTKDNDNDNKITIKSPFCMEQGLNYSDVYDKNSKTFTSELYKKTGNSTPPIASNLTPEFLMEKFGKEIMDLEFGEQKPLIDWL